MVVDVVWWGWAVVLKPNKFGWSQQASNHKLVVHVGVVSILAIYHLLQVDKPANDQVFVPTPDEVVQAG